MNQKSRPVADLAIGGWTPTPIYPQVNGSAGGGGVLSSPDGNGDTFDVQLAPLAWPQHWQDDPPGQTLTVTLGRTEEGDLSASVTLLQGIKVIAWQEEPEPAVGAGNIYLTLTQEEVERITDYRALIVRVTAGKPTVDCCGAVKLPETLDATIHTVTGCSELEGQKVRLSWSSATSNWQGLEIVCGMPLSFTLSCGGSTINGFSLVGVWANETTCTVPISGVLESSPAPNCNDPFLRFKANLVSIDANCPCCASAIATFFIDVTEAPSP